MEEFFKDVYFDFRDRPKDKRVRTAYTDLVVLYNRVLQHTTNWLCDDGHRRGPIGRVIAAAARRADDVTVVTFNHDLLIENEIFKRARLKARWCIDNSYGSFGEDLGRLSTGRDEFPAYDTGCDHSRPIRLLKLHGSLNWIVRIQGRQPTAKDLTGEGRLRDAFLNPSRVIEEPLIRRPGNGRGRHVWYTWPFVVPPIYAKQALISRLQSAWSDARVAVQTANILVFYGYSLPQLDIEAEKLFQRGIASNRGLDWIDVVNPDPAAAERYCGIAPKRRLRRYPTVDALLETDAFSGT